MKDSKEKYSIFSHYRYLYGRLWKYDWKLVIAGILEIILNAVKPLIAVMLPAFIVGLLEQGAGVKELVLSCVGAFAAAGLIYAGVDWIHTKSWFRYIFVRLDMYWTEVMNKCLNMDYVVYEKEEVQNDANKATDAINNNQRGIEGFYHNNIELGISVLGLIIYSLILSRVHPLIVGILLVLSLIQYVFHHIAEKYEDKHRDEQARRSRYQDYLFGQSANVKNGKDIRLFQLQHWLTELFEKYKKEYQKQEAKKQRLFYLYDFVGLTLNLLRDGACYSYLIYLLAKGMSIREFVLYLGVVSGFGSWFNQISNTVAKLSRCLVSIGHYRHFMDLQNVYLRDDGKVLEENRKSPFDIVFEDVSFRYPGSEDEVLQHISFRIHPGEKIALVGINGAGKTTLVKMLCGFYKPTSGRILINGVDITKLNIEKYFEQISVLFQDSILLSYTIAQNISGQPDDDTDKAKLLDVIEKSGLAEKVDTLTKKGDTFIGKDVEQEGVQLSGGQIQKLFLARALYKETYMLILDEPTAALDALAESELYEKYAELVADKTSVFISHRLSSTRFCDRIFFLEAGKIKESGTHEELLERGGSYANMFRVQSQYYVKEEVSCE